MRLFLAIPATPAVLECATEAQSILREHLTRQGVRFVSPEKMHLTLAFTGDRISEEDAIAIGERVAVSFPPMRLTVGSVGCFPDARRPKTIWLGVQGDEVLRLGEAIHQALESTELFVPHVTLARISPPSQAVGRILAGVAPTVVCQAEWEVEEFQLISTGPSGEYTVLRRFPIQVA